MKIKQTFIVPKFKENSKQPLAWYEVK